MVVLSNCISYQHHVSLLNYEQTKDFINIYYLFSVFVLILVINRIMVGLPSVENREKILRTLLAKEKVDQGLDIKELATMTEGYSGSDLKVVCFH